MSVAALLEREVGAGARAASTTAPSDPDPPVRRADCDSRSGARRALVSTSATGARAFDRRRRGRRGGARRRARRALGRDARSAVAGSLGRDTGGSAGAESGADSGAGAGATTGGGAAPRAARPGRGATEAPRYDGAAASFLSSAAIWFSTCARLGAAGSCARNLR